MVNYFAVFLVSIISFIIPSIWYSPILFAKSWAKYSGVKNMKLTPFNLSLAFISILILNFVLAIIINYSNFSSFVDGAVVGLLVWIGFIAPILLNPVLYEGKKIKLYVINAFHYLISLVISGGILAIWN